MNTMTFHANAGFPISLPRGARVAADLFARLLKFVAPEASLSEALSRADEAEHVRSLARRHEASDPGFAADLYAAASRHESIDDQA